MSPSRLFTHWLLYNIPRSAPSLEEGYKPSSPTETGANDFGKRGYGVLALPTARIVIDSICPINAGSKYMDKYAKKK